MTRRSVLAFALAWLPASTTQATTLQHLDLRTLTRNSPEIVVGKVEQVKSRWDERRTRILTDVTVSVSRVLKGTPRERVVLTQLGGEVEGVKVSVHGAPVFTLGQESVLFVWRDPQGRAQVNGMAQGKFDLLEENGEGRSVQRTAPGFAIRDARTLSRVRAGEAIPRIQLDELIRKINQVLAEEETEN